MGSRSGELLHRWRELIQGEDDDNPAASSLLLRLKEDWFSDAFFCLIQLPNECHIWCGSWDLMEPLLETFYNYFNDDSHDSPLKLLWKRISKELRQCTQCICHHYQAQESYNMEYESSSVRQLIGVLRRLDKERVTMHLKEINIKIARGEFDPVSGNAEVVSVMFEVLMFPVLLEDQSLVDEFETFIEAVDNSYELTLSGSQRYPGVYALLFLKSRRARSIGFRLAVHMGKLRGPADVEPLQPLLKRYISFLETDVLSSTTETCRSRMQLERIPVWHGIKALLGFLEPPAFEEGILQPYPIFLSIVLNHISDDSVEFSFAVNCLRVLFEMLGCKLWLSATLSPNVMLNTLLGQCFHTRNEKSHKDIFDLFQPFLQSLEAFQDGEHEAQRRHCLYFLLHQVTVSSNFSILMRRKACQIALRIIHRGYQMNPPCPPFECAHMWGPSLVSSLKDFSLHTSLRQPAFDLIQIIIVSDIAALVTAMMNNHTPSIIDRSMSAKFSCEDEDQGFNFVYDMEEKDISCWNRFSVQGKVAALEYSSWMCIPMLWVDVLVEIHPSVLPLSFSKAVFWVLSRVSIVEPLASTEMVLSVENWLTTCAKEISHMFGWKVPCGSDDGGYGKESKNSFHVSTMCIPLLRTLKRLCTHYILRMGNGELWKQWSWEPRMGESLILLLVDPDDVNSLPTHINSSSGGGNGRSLVGWLSTSLNSRQVARRILEHVSKTRTLACGLQFLCSQLSSLSATFLGLRHALKLVLLDSVLLKYQTLHHLFFVLCKILKEGFIFNKTLDGNSADDATMLKFSNQGGFLRQRVLDSLANNTDGHSETVDSKLWETFSCLVSVIAWPSVLRCLVEGKTFIDYKISQMTCIRLLETLPVVFERLRPSFNTLWGNLGMLVEIGIDFKWLLDLMDWGKSLLAVVVRYWKQTLLCLLDLLKGSCSDKSALSIRAIEELIISDNVSVDDVTEKVSHLSVSLVNEGSFKFEKPKMMSESPLSEDLLPKKCINLFAHSPFKDSDLQILDSISSLQNEEGDNVIVLSDDDTISEIPDHNNPSILSHQSMLDGSILDSGAPERAVAGDQAKKVVSSKDTSLDFLRVIDQTGVSDPATSFSLELESGTLKGILGSASVLKPKVVKDARKNTNSNSFVNDSSTSQHKSELKIASDKVVSSNMMTQLKKYNIAKNMDKQSIKKVSRTVNTVMRELVHDADNDPLEVAIKSAGLRKDSMSNVNPCGPKRQLIQINLPVENRCTNLHRLDGRPNRFKLPKLDDWYRPILEIDYFAMVGLVAPSEEENKISSNLKEVPVCFQSPDEYVSIFRPLVLEEFKAQLQSSYMETSFSEMCCGTLSVLSIERVDDFHIVRCVYDDIDSRGSKTCAENDLILLTRKQFQSCSHDVHMVGKVDRRENDYKRRSSVLVIRFYLQNGISRLNRARKLLLERSKWFISRLLSMSPQLREFQALSSIRSIPLLPVILNPISHHSGYSESREYYLNKLSQPLQQVLKSSYNDNQVQAINAGVGPLNLKTNFDLSLIQGPPGTGKTRTIVGIVSGLLSLGRMNATKRQHDSIKSDTSSSTSIKQTMSQSVAIARAWQDATFTRQLNVNGEQSYKFVGSCTRGRVLICAQSNAAVDELVSRISSDGLYGNDGMMYKPYLVRVGNAKTVHANSLPFFIDTLVANRLAEKINVSRPNNEICEDLAVLRSKLERLVDRIRLYESQRANLRDENSDSTNLFEGESLKEMSDAEIGARLRKLYSDKKEIYLKLAAAHVREKKATEETRTLKYKLRKSILREAEVVVTTLSGSGGDLYAVCAETFSRHKFDSSFEDTLFDAVVIDEAAQALEPATLIPLQLLKSRGTKCIMVGDPKQLPATVISNIASKYMYQCSMFERLQRAGHPVILLNKQYRMHPEISRFPSQHFYNGKLLNGDDSCIRKIPFHKTEVLGPYVFFDIVDGQELSGKNSGASSFYNECEADAAVEILRVFNQRYSSYFTGGRIGIVTPYKSQISLLRSRFSTVFGSSVTAEMEFNTVDGFQGREVDILVLSTVRAAGHCSMEHRINSEKIGFVADARRMNVALTRAKLSLWILGNARTLMANKNWEALINDAKKRNLLISIKKPYGYMFKSAWIKNPSVDSSDHHSVPVNLNEKFGEISCHAEQQNKSANCSYERKRYKRKSENGSGVLMGTDLSVANSSADGIAKEKSFTIAKRTTGDKSRGKMSCVEQLDGGNIYVGGGKDLKQSSCDLDQSEQMTHDYKKHLKSVSSERVIEPFKHDKMDPNLDAGNNCVEMSQERNENNKARASSQFGDPKSAITKRKQQRDAVDALLSSALVSSKKSETSVKLVPVKRSVSPTNTTGRSIRPPKPRKG